MSGASTAEAVNGNASPGEGLANEESKVVNLVWDKDSKPKPEKQVRKPARKTHLQDAPCRSHSIIFSPVNKPK